MFRRRRAEVISRVFLCRAKLKGTVEDNTMWNPLVKAANCLVDICMILGVSTVVGLGLTMGVLAGLQFTSIRVHERPELRNDRK